MIVAMLSRYRMVRGARVSELPQGVRQDTRKHTRHVLRPTAEMVELFLSDRSAASFRRFATAYRKLLDVRFAAERARFDELAERARDEDVYLGCSCPSAANPEVAHCHTMLALAFMKRRYPKLDVRVPSAAAPTP